MPTALLKITGYRIDEQIYAGNRTVVYRGIREQDLQPVILKMMRNNSPTFSELIQFRNQYTISKNLDIPGIVQAYSLEEYGNGYVLVMEDYGGTSLSSYLNQYTNSGKFTLDEFFPIAIAITATLGELHRKRIIYKDVKPANILIHPQTKQVKLIDFSIASLLPRETQQLQNPHVLEGTLAYISPEQTGRMNRGIDYRTDFYSLGVTFYELLTGKLPFESSDPIELVYCHIAKQPNQVNSQNIPQVLGDIVLKLMAKNAEDRYQSAAGLKSDLELCFCEWQEQRAILPFQLAQKDISDRFLIPEKLYGRQKEVETLLTVFDRVAGNKEQINQPSELLNRSELILITGFSGIGKTAVVNEVQKPIVRQRGYFITGKFDQFQRNIPFSAFVQALQDLMAQILTESDAQITQWQQKILAALGDNAQVIIDVIPELKKIIGTQPPVTELVGNAAQKRFNRFFRKFIQVFTTPEHPLVIFLDDLQWADTASLKLVQMLMSERQIRHLLLIGAYRNNEVSHTHPLMLTLEQIRTSQHPKAITTINLAPLTATDINHLFTDTLSCKLEEALPLTQIIYPKTQGNPFFTIQILKTLHTDGHINFASEIGSWQYDLNQVQTLNLTDNVVEFMILQLQKLPKATQDVLKLAACIGNTFDLATLAIVYEKSLTQTASDLWSALAEGLIMPTSQTYKLFQQKNEQIKPEDELAAEDSSLYLTETEVHFVAHLQHWSAYPAEDNHFPSQDYIYEFLHDRVQQAAYFLIDEAQKQITHLQIGKLLLQNIPIAEQEEQIFEIVNHLNMGLQLLTAPQEREKVAQLNLQAGRKAKASTAYATASQYLAIAMQLLAEDSWLQQYKLTFDIYKERSEVEYLNSNFEQSYILIQKALTQAQSAVEKAALYKLLIVQHTLQADYAVAIQVGKQALSLLGINLPEENIKSVIDAEIKAIKASLENQKISAILELPENPNPIYRYAIQLLIDLDPPTYITSAIDLYILVTLKAVNLSIQYGNVAESAKAYVNYGFLLGSVFGDYQTGYEFGVVATQLAEKFHHKGQKCQVDLLLGSWLHNWIKPTHLAIPINNAGYQAGLESGELQFAGYNLFGNICNQYFQGINLNNIRLDICKFLPFAHQTQNTLLTEMLLEVQKVIDSLMGYCNYQDSVECRHVSQTPMALAIAHILQAQLAYLQAQYQLALQYIIQAEAYLPAILGFTTSASYPFYHALILAALYPQVPPSTQEQYWQSLITHQNQLQIWAKNCPENFEHQYLLIQAEMARISKQEFEAMDLYDRAIASAKANGFTQNLALANELAVKFWLGKNKTNIAQLYLTGAVSAYTQWGATAQVKYLQAHYPELLPPHKALSPKELEYDQQSTISTSNINFSAQLDLAAFLKASQAIAGEIQLDQLLSILMQVMLENAGAKKSVLLLCKNNQLAYAAIAGLDEGKIFSHTNVSAIQPEESQDIPLTVINYVKRTLEPLVIDDIVTQSRFIHDPYIIKNQPRSVLCTPIINQGELIGLLYLENQLTSGVFTRDRLEVVQLLTAQAAISLKNAQLYTDLSTTTASLKQANSQLAEYSHTLEAKVAERTAQLEEAFKNLQTAQAQLIQNEKMSSLGQLVAGIAHEINNPISFIYGNLTPANEYIDDLMFVLQSYRQHYPHPTPQLQAQIAHIELDFITKDLPKILNSMQVGAERIRDIVMSLRNFSRLDEAEIKAVDIHEGIDSALMILQNRLLANPERPEICVIKEYSQLPAIKCYAGQLNQVFLNLLMNAIDALEESIRRGKILAQLQIYIRTQICDSEQIKIAIADNGMGISDSHKPYVFDPFFTTKQVGQGTGLGLSISYQIIVDKHQGQLECQSIPGEGAEFIITLPIRRITNS